MAVPTMNVEVYVPAGHRSTVGLEVGLTEGDSGTAVGVRVGLSVVGLPVGVMVGVTVVGIDVGTAVGVHVGLAVVGLAVGVDVNGLDVAVGADVVGVGAAVGKLDTSVTTVQ